MNEAPGMFANRKCEELSSKMCDIILVTLLKMQPHIISQPSNENKTPSNGTSPLASYKEVLPPQFFCKLRRDLGFSCSFNHLSGGGINANHNELGPQKQN